MFGNAGSVDHFLNTNRTRDESVIAAKPVFGGSDAHSFEQLEAHGGKVEEADQSAITWIKGDAKT